MEASVGCAWALGAPGAGTPPGLAEGPEPDPYSRTAGLRPHSLLETTSSLWLPHPPKYPSIAPHRRPRVTPTPTATAPSPGRSGGHRPGHQPWWQRRRRLGAVWSRGRRAAGPRPVPRGRGRRAASGQRLRRARTKRPRAPGAVGEAGGALTARRAAAGLAGSGDGGAPGSAARARGRRGGGGGRGVHGGAREPRCGVGTAARLLLLLQPRGAGTRLPGRAAALGGRGSNAAAFPFSCSGPWSPASSSALGPRRRLSLGASPASPLHQGRADPQGPSRKVRAWCRSPQLLVAIFNPPPPPAFSTSRGCLTDWLWILLFPPPAPPTEPAAEIAAALSPSPLPFLPLSLLPSLPSASLFPLSYWLVSPPSASSGRWIPLAGVRPPFHSSLAPRFPSRRTRPASFPGPCAQLLPFPSPSPCPSPAVLTLLGANFPWDSAEKGQLGSALLNPTPICWMLSDSDGRTEDCVNFTPAGVQKDCPR